MSGRRGEGAEQRCLHHFQGRKLPTPPPPQILTTLTTCAWLPSLSRQCSAQPRTHCSDKLQASRVRFCNYCPHSSLLKARSNQ